MRFFLLFFLSECFKRPMTSNLHQRALIMEIITREDRINGIKIPSSDYKKVKKKVMNSWQVINHFIIDMYLRRNVHLFNTWPNASKNKLLFYSAYCLSNVIRERWTQSSPESFIIDCVDKKYIYLRKYILYVHSKWFWIEIKNLRCIF